MTLASEHQTPSNPAQGGRDEVLRFDRVTVHFDETVALDSVSFAMTAGETRVILGAAGSGKTVLIKTAVGLVKADAGRVYLFGSDITDMTNTVSDFGREMDSLADVITFGIAPAVLAFAWGLQFVDRSFVGLDALLRAGYFICFMFLLCGASRLARFNVTTNPMPKNPGRPDRKYFVGMPIPSAAALVAAVVYVCGSAPLRW